MKKLVAWKEEPVMEAPFENEESEVTVSMNHEETHADEDEKDDILFLTDFIKKQAGQDFGAAGDPADESLRYLLGAQEEYINSFYSAVEETYGSVDRLIRDGLKLTEEEISSLKSRYLV